MAEGWGVSRAIFWWVGRSHPAEEERNSFDTRHISFFSLWIISSSMYIFKREIKETRNGIKTIWELMSMDLSRLTDSWHWDCLTLDPPVIRMPEGWIYRQHEGLNTLFGGFLIYFVNRSGEYRCIMCLTCLIRLINVTEFFVIKKKFGFWVCFFG